MDHTARILAGLRGRWAMLARRLPDLEPRIWMGLIVLILFAGVFAREFILHPDWFITPTQNIISSGGGYL